MGNNNYDNNNNNSNSGNNNNNYYYCYIFAIYCYVIVVLLLLLCQLPLLTITVKITINETFREKSSNNVCYIQTTKRLSCLICSVKITFIKTKRSHMFLSYNISIIPFVLKIFPFQHGLLMLSPNLKLRYSHSEDNVRENIFGYTLGSIVFALFKNCNMCFCSYLL